MADPTDLQLDGVERILVVMAHPDDCDFGAGGTIARWVDAGVEVSYCIATDGDQGGFDESVSRTDMARIRREEQTAAGEALGVHDITFLGYGDGRVYPTVELRRDISRVIRQKRPQRVLCQSPEINYARIHASHPDHRHTGEAALAAVYPDSRNPFAHPELLEDEGLREHTVDSTWITAAPVPAIAIDITDVFDRKLAALRCHASQLPKPAELEAMVRSWNERTAAQFGLGDGRLAEAFLTIDTR